MRKCYIRKNGEPYIDNATLRVKFNIEVFPGNALSLCEIIVYNLAKTSEPQRNDSIELVAGDDIREGVIFSGIVINTFREPDSNKADKFTRIICRTNTLVQRGSVSTTYGEGATIIDALKDIATAWPLRLDIDESQFADTPPFTSGRSFDGDLPSILSNLATEYDFEYVEHVGRLIIAKPGQIREDVQPIKVSQLTGMQGIPEVNRGPMGLGVDVMKHLDPFIYPNSTIEIDTKYSTFNTGNVYFGEVGDDVSANGVYNVLSLIHKGDTHGDGLGAWTTEIHAMRSDVGVGSNGIVTEYEGTGDLVWGKRVPQEFRVKAREVAQKLRMNPDFLMAVIAFETGGTFDPTIKNRAGSGATGLIQFMPETAEGLGTTTSRLARMSAVEQLDYVYAHYRPFTGRLNSLGDSYMAVLYPVAVGKPDSYVLFTYPSKKYNQNSGLDVNKDGKITKKEATTRVARTLNEGMKFKG